MRHQGLLTPKSLCVEWPQTAFESPCKRVIDVCSRNKHVKNEGLAFSATGTYPNGLRLDPPEEAQMISTNAVGSTSVDITCNRSFAFGHLKIGILEYRTGAQTTARETAFYAGAHHIYVSLPAATCLSLLLVVTAALWAEAFGLTASRARRCTAHLPADGARKHEALGHISTIDICHRNQT